MVFKQVFQGDYFGGRTLIAERDMRNVKRQILRQVGILEHQSNANEFVMESLKKHNKIKVETAITSAMARSRVGSSMAGAVTPLLTKAEMKPLANWRVNSALGMASTALGSVSRQGNRLSTAMISNTTNT